MKGIWISLQTAVALPVFLLLKILRVVVVHENNISPEIGCLLISNHESKMDPYFILVAYGLRKTFVNLPYQFPVLEEYMSKPFLGKVITFFGGFSVGETITEKARSLFYIRSVLEKKGSVLIFPEARLVKGDHNFEDFQKGYTYLISGNVQVILTKLEGFHSAHKELFHKKRPRITFRTIPSQTKKETALNIIKEFYEKN